MPHQSVTEKVFAGSEPYLSPARVRLGDQLATLPWSQAETGHEGTLVRASS